MSNNEEPQRKTDPCILFLTKWPTPGYVKTRLGAQIGDDRAADLYQAFVHDLLQTLKTLKCVTVCCYDPYVTAEVYENWLGPEHQYQAQEGTDLGQRLDNAFKGMFTLGFQRVIVIGTDSPDMPQDYLQQALTALTSHDATIGPSQDGGYYLIGFSRQGYRSEVFQGIPWSTDKVFEQTRMRLKQQCRVHVLPGWYDIDTLEDLHQLHHRHRQSYFTTSETVAALNKKTRL